MSKQNVLKLQARSQIQSNPLFDPQALEKFVSDSAELNFVGQSGKAILLFPDGKLVEPNRAGDKNRTTYHYVMKYYFSYIGLKKVPEIKQKDQRAFNNLVTKGVGAINLIPETWSALKGDQQDTTVEQKQFLEKNQYKLYSYVKNEPITTTYLKRIGAS